MSVDSYDLFKGVSLGAKKALDKSPIFVIQYIELRHRNSLLHELVNDNFRCLFNAPPRRSLVGSSNRGRTKEERMTDKEAARELYNALDNVLGLFGSRKIPLPFLKMFDAAPASPPGVGMVGFDASLLPPNNRPT